MHERSILKGSHGFELHLYFFLFIMYEGNISEIIVGIFLCHLLSALFSVFAVSCTIVCFRCWLLESGGAHLLSLFVSQTTAVKNKSRKCHYIHHRREQLNSRRSKQTIKQTTHSAHRKMNDEHEKIDQHSYTIQY